MVRLVLFLMGGLGLFFFGMELLSDGLKKAAGSKLRDILKLLTQNRVMGVLVGAGITSIIQSSSATTVIVVSFINAGLMTLHQAVGVIMGANIGTTITAWLVSSLAVLDITNYALPAVGIGFLFHFLGKRRKTKSWGQAILGFGLLFLGLNFMKDALQSLKDNESVIQFLLIFSSKPIWGVVAGALVTGILQSSSATIAMFQVMAFSGLIDFNAAIALILGSNIGTTVTAQLAAINTNRAARQAANVHTLFNVFGVIFALPFVYLGWYRIFMEWLIPGELTVGNIMVYMAAAHSVFNIATTLVFLPNTVLLEKAAEKITRKREGDQPTSYRPLEKHLFSAPHLALVEVTKEFSRMLQLAQQSLEVSLAALFGDGPDKLKIVRSLEDEINYFQRGLMRDLAKLSREDISPHTSEQIVLLLHGVNDAERIGDHAVNVSERAEVIFSEGLQFSSAARHDLQTMVDTVREMLSLTILAVNDDNKELAKQALEREAQLNTFQQQFRDGHIRRFQAGTCDPEAGVVFLEIINNLEKVGDHLTNILQAILGSYRIP